MVNYFPTAKTDAHNLWTIKLTLNYKIFFVIIVASSKFFKILTTCECLFFSIFFFIITVSALNIAVSDAIKGIAINEVKIWLYVISSYLSNQTFWEAVYFFFWLICHNCIYFIYFLNSFSINRNGFIQIAKTYIMSIDIRKKLHFIFLSEW